MPCFISNWVSAHRTVEQMLSFSFLLSFLTLNFDIFLDTFLHSCNTSGVLPFHFRKKFIVAKCSLFVITARKMFCCYCNGRHHIFNTHNFLTTLDEVIKTKFFFISTIASLQLVNTYASYAEYGYRRRTDILKQMTRQAFKSESEIK